MPFNPKVSIGLSYFVRNQQANLILQRKNVVQFPVKIFRPNMKAIIRPDELSSDANTVARFPDTPFKNKWYTQLVANMPNIFLYFFKYKRGGACRDFQPINFT